MDVPYNSICMVVCMGHHAETVLRPIFFISEALKGFRNQWRSVQRRDVASGCAPVCSSCLGGSVAERSSGGLLGLQPVKSDTVAGGLHPAPSAMRQSWRIWLLLYFSACYRQCACCIMMCGCGQGTEETSRVMMQHVHLDA